MKFTKLAGWLLLLIGLLVIGYALRSSFQIFTGRQEAYPLFAVPAENSSPSDSSDLTEIMNQALEEQLGNFLPAGSISQLLNLVSWSIFASIFIFGGGKISGLGLQLLKKDKD